jgi:hypothetical protein
MATTAGNLRTDAVGTEAQSVGAYDERRVGTDHAADESEDVTLVFDECAGSVSRVD